MRTFDSRTVTSTGAFLTGELEKLDPEIYEPLVGTTWMRDMMLRDDVVMTDEAASYAKVEYGAPGMQGEGKSWSGKNATSAPAVSVQHDKTVKNLHLWELGADWTIIELEQALKLGRPIDKQKFAAVTLKFQLDADEMVYVGDKQKGACGLINNPDIAPANFTANWLTATPEAVLADFNAFLAVSLKRTGNLLAPLQALLPSDRFAAMCRPVSSAGSTSILTYVANECVAAQKNHQPLEILDLNRLDNAGVAGKGRAVLYRREKDKMRWPHVPMQRTAVENRGLHQLVTWYCRLGEVEFIQPETVSYCDFV